MPMSAGDKLRFWRQTVGLTQQELARSIGAHKPWISRLELGQIPITEYMKKRLASKLSIPEECLTDSAPDPWIIALPTPGMVIMEDGVEYQPLSCGKKGL